MQYIRQHFNIKYFHVTGNGHIETAEWLLKTDVSGRLISAKDKNGDTPAHDAAENG